MMCNALCEYNGVNRNCFVLFYVFYVLPPTKTQPRLVAPPPVFLGPIEREVTPEDTIADSNIHYIHFDITS